MNILLNTKKDYKQILQDLIDYRDPEDGSTDFQIAIIQNKIYINNGYLPCDFYINITCFNFSISNFQRI